MLELTRSDNDIDSHIAAVSAVVTHLDCPVALKSLHHLASLLGELKIDLRRQVNSVTMAVFALLHWQPKCPRRADELSQMEL